MGGVVSKWLPKNDVVEFTYMSPTSSTKSWGHPRSSIKASSHVWLMELNAFRKSVYVNYMSLFVNLVSSRMVRIIWICHVIFHCDPNTSWLKCKSQCFSPQLVRRDVRVLIYNLLVRVISL